MIRLHNVACSAAAAPRAYSSAIATVSVLRPWMATTSARGLPVLGNLVGRTYATIDPSSSTMLSGASASALAPDDPAARAAVPVTQVLQYWNNIYPVKLGRFDFFTTMLSVTDPIRLASRVTKQLPRELRDQGVRVASVDARLKDGGAFVTLEIPEPLQVQAVTEAINTKLGAQGVLQSPSVFHQLGSGSAHPVLGRKFNEDIASLTPSTRLKVESVGGDLSLESLYETFRPYGEIADIRIVGPKIATVQFKHLRSATAARNCTYKLTVDGNAVIKSSYEKLLKTHHIWDWMSGHPRIVLPILVALAVTLGVAIFDPIHVFMIESKLIGRFRLGLSRWFPNLSSYFPGFVVSGINSLRSTFGSNSRAVNEYPLGLELDDFNGGDQHVKRIRSLMYEAPESLVVISGPAGIGKSELANTVTTLPAHPDAPKLVIDCETFVQRSHTDADVIRIISKQLGYWPLFYSLNKLTAYVDMALTATTGTKTNMSVSDESMLKHMLECASVALSQVVKNRKPNDPYPMIVLDNFNRDKPGKSFAQYYDLLAQWAGFLVEAGLAHVVVVASSGQRGGGEVGVMQAIGRALPTKTVDVITLRDMSPVQAEKYLALRLNVELGENRDAALAAGYPSLAADTHKVRVADEESKRIVAAIGGRASDLELVVHKLADGKSVDVALEEMVQKAMLELQKNGMRSGASWTPAQFCKQKSGKDDTDGNGPVVSFDKIRFSTLFNGNEAALFDMERAELLALVYDNARPIGVRLNKPLFATALQRMTQEDKRFSAAMDVVMYKELYKVESAKVKAYEDEYLKLAEAAGRLSGTKHGVDKAIDERLTHLADAMALSQAKVKDYWNKLLLSKQQL
ncbi:RNA12 protein-domain-containing protein [Catenaria anguillulae PL171]|uniref:Mitochondrial escape protein 2 n=1 Tax=Catenaria anguillulae PL171 TaxID=765915 RepID=A0A1Y2I445_9FUNG|nr:RNA12 protein-domain-containing protein [Catenaria anguillulae PL171]